MRERIDAKEQRQIEDLNLIEKIRQGDADSLEKLVNRYLSQLAGFFHYLRVPELYLEDMIQETFEKIIRNLEKFDSRKPFVTWLLTVARNHYFDLCRKEKRQSEFKTQNSSETSESPEDTIVDRETASDILKELSPSDRFLLELRIFQKMPFSEIAEITGEVEGTLRSKFFRLLGRLRISRRVNEISNSSHY